MVSAVACAYHSIEPVTTVVEPFVMVQLVMVLAVVDVSMIAGVVGDTGTPPEIVNKLNREIVRILALPDVQEALLVEGGEITPTTPQEFAALIRSELQLWRNVVRQAGIAID